MSARSFALVVLVAVLGGCLNAEPSPAEDGADVWPAGLVGPFEVHPVENLLVTMRDGVGIEMAIWKPVVPAGVGVPVVLHAQPYADACITVDTQPSCWPPLEDPVWLDVYNATGRLLLEQGYAFVNLSVRGTGDSGGCVSLNGPDEAADLGEVIEVLGAEPWSNGHVAMFGLSYMGTTPWLGALQGKAALKAIVAGGIVTNEYTFSYTPQGAGSEGTAAFNVPYFAGLTLVPPVVGATGGPSNDPGQSAEWAQVAPERVCPELARALAAYPVGAASDIRDAQFFSQRNSLVRLGELRIPVLAIQGFHETNPAGHAYEEDAISQMLTQANLTMVLGQWGHTFPDGQLLAAHPTFTSWPTLLLPFLDHALKGDSAPAWMGSVTFQDIAGTWRTSTAWPPSEAREEALFAGASGLRPEKPQGSFVLRGMRPSSEPVCAEDLPGSGTSLAVVTTVTEPTDGPVVLAGNPRVDATVTSEVPSGLLAVDLYDWAPGAHCEDGVPVGMTWLSSGAADLRFHASPFRGQDFPVATPTPVRIDLLNVAHTLPAGHQVALVWSSWGKPGYLTARPATTLTLEAGSTSLVLPILEGSLGGPQPAPAWSPRPFTTAD